MNKIVKNTLILTLITVIAGFLLGVVYEVTKTPISQAQETAKKEAWQAVFSDVKLGDFKAEDVDQKAADKAVKDMGVNATIDEVCTAGDAGYVITTTDKDGFGGNIQITVGIKKDGTINGVSILSISETAGLGMKAQTTNWKDQFVGMSADAPLEYTKNGEEGKVDAISGATVTTNAMTNGTNAAIALYQSIQE